MSNTKGNKPKKDHMWKSFNIRSEKPRREGWYKDNQSTLTTQQMGGFGWDQEDCII